MLLLCRTSPRERGREADRRHDAVVRRDGPRQVTIRPIPKMGRNAVDTNELFIDGLFVADEDVVGEEGKGFRAILGGLNAERVISRQRGARHRQGRAAPRRSSTPRSAWCSAGRSARTRASRSRWPRPRSASRRPRPCCSKAAWMVDQGLPCGAEANKAKWLCAEAGFYAADVAPAGARRLRLRQGVPRRAVLPRVPAHADRADQPGDGPQLRRRARARPAPQLLMEALPLDPLRPRPQARLDRQGAGRRGRRLVLDLEDSVPADLKAAARQTVAESIARVRETNSASASSSGSTRWTPG